MLAETQPMRELYYLSQGELLPQTERVTTADRESYSLRQGELLRDIVESYTTTSGRKNTISVMEG